MSTEKTSENKNVKVFIVDNDKFLLGMYSTKFAEAGYDVDVAVGPDAALEKLRAGIKPEIMVFDTVMSPIDGIDLLKTIRDEKLAPDAAVIILTNQDQRSDIARAKELNVDGYIVKATTIPSEVLHEVEKIYATKKAK